MAGDGEVVVFSNRYVQGWDGEPNSLDGNQFEFGEVLPLREALTRHWETDAHFSGYVCPGNSRQPRLNDASLEYFETQAPGQMPELRVVGVDVDFPDHGDSQYGWENYNQWPGRLRGWFDEVNQAVESAPELLKAGFYQTRGGCRFVWPLAEARRMGVPLAESYISQFLEYLIDDKGLPADRLTDWNRLFRLPYVVRDGVFQDYSLELGDMEPLDWSPPEGLVRASFSETGEAARESLPATDSIDSPTKGDYKDLKGQWYYRHLVNGLPLAEEGERHETVKQVVGSIVAKLNTNDPLLPFRLIKDSIDAMDSRSDPFDYREAWKICVWTCKVHDGAEKQRESRAESFLERSARAMGCAPREVKQQLILVTKTNPSYYIWDEEKMEYQSPTSDSKLLEVLLERHCPRLSGIVGENISQRDILKQYSTPIEDIVYCYNRRETEFDIESGVLYEAVLDYDPYLKPKFNKDIDRWLKALFGEHVTEGLDWLASFLELDSATCAIYIDGPPNIGKGLLPAGIARLFQTVSVPYRELLSNFQEALVDCPLIVADEQVPSDPFENRGSSVFRRSIGSSRFKINRKHRSPADLKGSPRILITANNADALQIDEALGSDDIEAIQSRIGYIRADETPRDVLKSLAREKGLAVREMTEEWVQGGAIAQHVLWLNENREVEPGDRFLVEGWESELTRSLSNRLGNVPVIGKFIVRCLRDHPGLPAVEVSDEGEVWTNLEYMQDRWSLPMGKSSRPPEHQELMRAVKVLSGGKKKRMRPDESSSPRYYWQIEVERIVDISEEFHLMDREDVYNCIRKQIESDDVEAMDASMWFDSGKNQSKGTE